MGISTSVSPLETPPDHKEDISRSLLIKCQTPTPSLFANLPANVDKLRQDFSKLGVDIRPITTRNGFTLGAEDHSALSKAINRLWQLDLTDSTPVKELGLWEIEILKNQKQENPLLLVRTAHVLCEQTFQRKKVGTYGKDLE